MANYRLTKAAESDLFNIYQYSVENFGLGKAREYFEDFQTAFEIIGDNPQIGRDFDLVKQGYRRYEHKNHSIYYIASNGIVLIVRVLGSAQDPIKNLS